MISSFQSNCVTSFSWEEFYLSGISCGFLLKENHCSDIFSVNLVLTERTKRCFYLKWNPWSQIISNVFTLLLADTIVFSSTAGAAEYAGAVLGEFVKFMELEGRPFYRQRNTEGSRSVVLGSGGIASIVGWLVTDLGNSSGLLTNDQDSDLPPKANWLYYN